MARILYNNSSGVLGASLTSSGIALTFQADPGWPTLVSPDYIPLALEPPSAGSPSANYEIVHVTAYVHGSGTATIVRGQEGTSQVAHASGVTWMCAVTTGDLSDISSRLLGGSAPTWNAGTSYQLSQWVTGSDGRRYFSEIPNNVGNDPTLDHGANWGSLVGNALPAAPYLLYPSGDATGAQDDAAFYAAVVSLLARGGKGEIDLVPSAPFFTKQAWVLPAETTGAGTNTGTLTSGSTGVTALAAGVAKGGGSFAVPANTTIWAVSGRGVAPNTTLTLTGASTATLSNPAVLSVTGGTLILTPIDTTGTLVTGDAMSLRGIGNAKLQPVGANATGIYCHRVNDYISTPVDADLASSIRGITVEGSLATGASIGIDVGDGDGFDVDVSVQNFQTSGAIGAYINNRATSTNRSHFTIQSLRNSKLVYVDSNGGGTSMKYNRLLLSVDGNSDQSALVIDGINLNESTVELRGTMASSSSNSGAPTGNCAAISLVNTGSCWRSTLDVSISNNGKGTGTVFPYCVYSDGNGGIQQCTGRITTQMGAATMNGAECSFSGPFTAGDALPYPSTAFPGFGVAWINKGPDATVHVSGGGTTDVTVNGVDAGTATGNWLVGAGGSVIVAGSGAAPTFTVFPSRVITSGTGTGGGGGGGTGGGGAALVGSSVNLDGTAGHGYDANANYNTSGATNPSQANFTNAGVFDGYVFGSGSATKMARQLQKVYLTAGNGSGQLPSTCPAAWSSFVNTHGGKLLISLRPTPNGTTGSAVNFPDATTDAAFSACVAGLFSALGTNWKGILWQECNQPPFAGAGNPFPNSASSYHAYVAHYAPLFRTHAPGVALVYDPEVATGSGNGGSGNQSGAVSYYPGSSYTDEIYVDYYCTSYAGGQRLNDIAALADTHGVPFGIGEWGAAAASLTLATFNANWNNYINYLTNGGPDGFQGLLGRRTVGKTNGWCVYFASDGGGQLGNTDGTGNGIPNATDPKLAAASSPFAHNINTFYTAVGT